MVLLLCFLFSNSLAQEYPIKGKNYRFSYAVEDNYSGNQFGHTENRDGAGTAGVYHVRLPDGRLQTVEYTVDGRGYHATVLYEGGSPVPSLGPTSPAQFVHHEPVIYLDDGGGGRSSLQYNYLPPPPAHPPGYTIPQPPATISPAYNNLRYTNTLPHPPPHPYQASYSVLQPQYLPYNSHNNQVASFILPQIFDTEPAPLPGFPPSHAAPQAPAAPAHVSQEHLAALSLPLVRPPEPHKESGPHAPDPYLASEKELKGKKFDDPFWYPKHRHIVKGYRNKDRGDKTDHRDFTP